MTEIEDRILVFFNEKDTLPTGETRTISQVAQVLLWNKTNLQNL